MVQVMATVSLIHAGMRPPLDVWLTCEVLSADGPYGLVAFSDGVVATVDMDEMLRHDTVRRVPKKDRK